jgi:hypothetical protein
MPLYFFDTRDNDDLVQDDIGIDFFGLEAVKIEAARALANLRATCCPEAWNGSLASKSGTNSGRSSERS